jgi:hypothetical protein
VRHRGEKLTLRTVGFVRTRPRFVGAMAGILGLLSTRRQFPRLCGQLVRQVAKLFLTKLGFVSRGFFSRYLSGVGNRTLLGGAALGEVASNFAEAD